MLFLNEQTVVNPTRNTLSNDINFVIETFQLSEYMEAAIKAEYIFLNEEVDVDNKDSKFKDYLQRARDYLKKAIDRLIATVKEFSNKFRQMLKSHKEKEDKRSERIAMDAGKTIKIPSNLRKKWLALQAASGGLYLSFNDRAKGTVEFKQNTLDKVKEKYFTGKLDEPFSDDLVEIEKNRFSDIVSTMEDVVKDAEKLRNNINSIASDINNPNYTNEQKAADREYLSMVQTIISKAMEFLSKTNSLLQGN